jgi:hypothetical protein
LFVFAIANRDPIRKKSPGGEKKGYKKKYTTSEARLRSVTHSLKPHNLEESIAKEERMPVFISLIATES